ncbi:LysR substrate-binding domain-containing protein [Dechloromonas sp. ZY10]|uniref:LysR family transcriptional regulator n=1 Tax=Dechloromonas aquae TaxID=2664436 RepID=UPI00352869B9
MELIALRTFVAVVEAGGILAAAGRLNTVQSNVTGRIRKLEDEFASELFQRKGRGLELAPAGRVLLDYARRMLELERQTLAAVRQVGECSGELRIGAMETFAALHLPQALKAVRSAHPKVELRVYTEPTARLVDKVLAHKLDAAFVAGPVVHPDLTFSEVVAEELVQVHATGCDPVRLPLILFREGCAYRTRALAWQRSIGHATADVMEFGTLDGILGCVSVGLGWTLMPRRIVEQSRQASELIITPVPDEIARVPTGLIRRHEVSPLRALQTLVEAFTPPQAWRQVA